MFQCSCRVSRPLGHLRTGTVCSDPVSRLVKKRFPHNQSVSLLNRFRLSSGFRLSGFQSRWSIVRGGEDAWWHCSVSWWLYSEDFLQYHIQPPSFQASSGFQGFQTFRLFQTVRYSIVKDESPLRNIRLCLVMTQSRWTLMLTRTESVAMSSQELILDRTTSAPLLLDTQGCCLPLDGAEKLSEESRTTCWKSVNLIMLVW